MRKSREQTAQTRRRIVEAASKEFRRNGLDKTGLSDLMAAAGLTHGGFYRHFDSKDEVVAEACARAIEDMSTVVGQRAAIEAGKAMNVEKAIQNYLSLTHLKNVEDGCPFAALVSDLARGSASVRRMATEGFKGVVTSFAMESEAQGDGDAWARALGLATSMIGAVSLARMVDEPELAERILSEAQTRLRKEALGS